MAEDVGVGRAAGSGSRCTGGSGGKVGNGLMAGTEGTERFTSGAGLFVLGVAFGVIETSGGVFEFRGGSTLGIVAMGRADTTELAASESGGRSFDGNVVFDGNAATV